MYKTWDNVSNALKLAWKHKILWIFAMLAVTSGFNFNSSNIRSSGDSSSDQKTQEETQKELQNYFEELKNSGDSYDYNYNSESTSSSNLNININNNTVLEDNQTDNEQNSGGNVNTESSLFPVDKYIDAKNSAEESAAKANQYNKELEEQLNEIENSVLGATTKKVLGTSSGSLDFLGFILENFLPHILIVSFSFLALVIVGIVVGLIVRSWAIGSLVQGSNDVLTQEKLNLKDLGQAGIKSISKIISLKIFLFFITFFLLLLMLLPLLIWIISDNALIMLTYVPLVFLFVITLFFVNYGAVYGYRYLILKNDYYLDAFKKGLHTFRSNLGKTFKLIFANCLVQMGFMMVIGVVVITIVGVIALVIGGMAAFSDVREVKPALILSAFILGLPIFMVFIFGMAAFNGYMATFKEITWTTLFNFLTGEKTEGAAPTQTTNLTGEIKQNG